MTIQAENQSLCILASFDSDFRVSCRTTFPKVKFPQIGMFANVSYILIFLKVGRKQKYNTLISPLLSTNV